MFIDKTPAKASAPAKDDLNPNSATSEKFPDLRKDFLLAEEKSCSTRGRGCRQVETVDFTTSVTKEMDASLKQVSELLKKDGSITIPGDSRLEITRAADGSLAIKHGMTNFEWKPGATSLEVKGFPKNWDREGLNRLVVDMPDAIERERSRHLDPAVTAKASEVLQKIDGNTVHVDIKGEKVEVSRRYDGTLFFGPGGRSGEVTSTGYLQNGDREMITAALEKVAKGEFTKP